MCCFREIFGPNGQLIEIMNEEDQNLAVNVTKNLWLNCDENCDLQWNYWWTGLQDDDDDAVWKWSRSK